MDRRINEKSIVEYGVETENSRCVLLVTQDLAEAQHTLDLIGEGRLVRRTTTHSEWITVATQTLILEPGGGSAVLQRRGGHTVATAVSAADGATT